MVAFDVSGAEEDTNQAEKEGKGQSSSRKESLGTFQISGTVLYQWSRRVAKPTFISFTFRTVFHTCQHKLQSAL